MPPSSDQTAPRPLSGVRVVEVASFVAGPSAGLTLAQLGAEVIRVDPVGGAPDVNRWPVTDSGRSIYWAGLNRGKRSVVLDLGAQDGQRTLQALITGTGAQGGVLLSNVSGKTWLSDEVLRAARPDLVHVQVLGRSDGAPAVDYTVNALTGLPYATGPADSAAPVNHAIPPWDLLCGMQAAVAVLAGLHRRAATGAGTYATVSLEDVAMATLTTLGFLPEAQLTGHDRPAYGNVVYGTFGADLRLADGERVMVVALTPRQWRALVDVTGTGAVVTALQESLGSDFTQEGERWKHHEVLTAVLRPWFAARTSAQVHAELDGTHVLWAPYRRLTDAATDLVAGGSPVVSVRSDAGLGDLLASSGAIRLRHEAEPAPGPAPVLGEHTDEVLAEADVAAPAERR